MVSLVLSSSSLSWWTKWRLLPLQSKINFRNWKLVKMKGILSIVCYCFEWVMARNGTALRRCAVQSCTASWPIKTKNESKLNITYYNAFLRLNTHFPSNQSLDPVGPSRADSPGWPHSSSTVRWRAEKKRIYRGTVFGPSISLDSPALTWHQRHWWHCCLIPNLEWISALALD